MSVGNCKSLYTEAWDEGYETAWRKHRQDCQEYKEAIQKAIRIIYEMGLITTYDTILDKIENIFKEVK